ncbi:MAG: DUF1259 domain-containing protein [Candidatus Eremiobacteraeota bacterium]|nr:DUF1259 domain-containing protein [Candidatus Eremiobacteraeota bacterium]
MANSTPPVPRNGVSRRQLLSAGGAALAGGFVGTAIAGCMNPGTGTGSTGGTLPSTASVPDMSQRSISTSQAQIIQQIVQAQGTIDNGVLSIEIDRKDITGTNIRGTPILPSFEINGGLVFQSIGGGVYMNGDMALKTSEVDPFLDALFAHNVIWQAEHQHFYDLTPEVWFVHFRMEGSPQEVARAIKAALDVTSTPFPQTLPSNPTTPLPAKQIGQIIGAKPNIGSDGVVSLNIPRANPIVLGGIRINPYLNIMTAIAFQPLGGGNQCAAVSDYGMIASEVQRVISFMRHQGWDSGCLYNQETDEQPQLYFDHVFKTGSPLELAREIRAGLNLMNVVCS